MSKLTEVPARGTKQERELFTKVIRHYEMAKQDLEQRIPDWNTKDELFRSHIDEDNHPYNSVVFDPRIFTAIFEKTSRLFANKPRGRMVPREGGDTLGARINNELLSYQWDENERVDNQPMLAKWAMMDQNTRKYGASFGLCKWRYERKLQRTKDKKGKDEVKSMVSFDGPDFKPLVNRDVLANPSYSTIKGWFAYREYVTLEELKNINDAARSKAIYKNLDILRDSLAKEGEGGGDTRETNWSSKNKEVKGLEDYLGKDEFNKTVEVVTEYTPERWTTYAPKHGVILRDIPNPYDHGQIPVVMLRYFQVDDDLYGLSEIEPVQTLQKAVNALVNQYLDSVNMSLYTPLKIRANAVQMHTLEFGPGAKWIMNDPTDVMPHETSGKGVTEFASTYRFMIGAMQEALGETSASTSNLDPGAADKTATEIMDLSKQRNARDNYNQIFLSEALKKQMMLWFTMNKQFLFSGDDEQQKVIRIVGKDAIKYFQQRALDGMELTDEAIAVLTAEGQPESVQMEMASLLAEGKINPQDYLTPANPVDVDGETMPKFSLEPGNEMGYLILEKEDLSGQYDYIPDVESMSIPDSTQLVAAAKQMIDLNTKPETVQLLAQQGYTFNLKEAMEDFFEQLGHKDTEKYFTKLQAQNETFASGQASPQAGNGNQGIGGAPGLQGVPQATPGNQAQPVVS
jgi:hypothetical protein